MDEIGSRFSNILSYGNIPGIMICDNQPTSMNATVTHCLCNLLVLNSSIVIEKRCLKNKSGFSVKVGSTVRLLVHWVHDQPVKVISAEFLPCDKERASKGQSSIPSQRRQCIDQLQFNSTYRVGKIVRYSRDQAKGCIDGFLDFSTSHCSPGYLPASGDWVQVEVNSDGTVKSVSPNRVGQVIGKIRWNTRADSANETIGSLANCALLELNELAHVAGIKNHQLTYFANVVERSAVSGMNGWQSSGLVGTQGDHLDRWKARFSWRVLNVVPVDDITLTCGCFEMEGCLYWSVTEHSSAANTNAFVLRWIDDNSCGHGNASPDVSIEDIGEQSPFTVLNVNTSFLDAVETKFEVKCQLTSGECQHDLDNHASLMISHKKGVDVCNHSFLLLYQSDFNFNYPIRSSRFGQYEGRMRLRSYEDAAVENGGSGKASKCTPMKGRRLPPLYITGSVSYEPPKRIKEIYTENLTRSTDLWSLLCEEYGDMVRPLESDNYAQKLHFMLHLEQVAREIQAFSLPELPVTFVKQGEYLNFEWPYEDEGVINIFYNDKIVVDGKHNGFVHKIDGCLIGVKFDDAFHNSYKHGQICRIRVIPNTATFRRCHEAIHQANQRNIPDLFTKQLEGRPCPDGRSECISEGPTIRCVLERSNFKWFNTKLNDEQKSAIVCMLSPSSQAKCLHPFVLFGPPGTGKTVTLVEAINQAYHRSRCSKILACAPSNAAADVICSKLIASEQYTPTQLGRLYAHSRAWDQVPEEVKPFALMLSGGSDQQYNRDGANSLVTDADLARRILITTFVCSSQLRLGSGRHLVFSHVFLDECAQASEPESLIPIIYSQNYGETGDCSGVVALAGDPFQLGPTLISTESQRLGLDISLLERLFNCKACNKNNADLDFTGMLSRVVYLRRTYRFRHAALIEVPSRLFYKQRLIVESRPDDDEKNYLPPLKFVNVDGATCKRGADGLGCSLYNEAETVLVCREVIAALKDQECRSIGVITPYRAQVKNIRRLLPELLDTHASTYVASKFQTIKIGSVEEFQGSECDLIIVSTVRTSDCHSLGFLTSPKRFNVALTRARNRLIVIGSAEALVTNVNWLHFIRYAKSNIDAK